MTYMDPRIYPIGKPAFLEEYSPEEKISLIDAVENLPDRLSSVVFSLENGDLEKTYRDRGWTVRQIIHHIADSHLNAYARFKLALTEDNPVIKPYLHNDWALTADNALDVDVSLLMLDGIHRRWTVLLKNMTPLDFKRTFTHPVEQKSYSLQNRLGLYAWHGDHHLAQVLVALGKI